MKLFKKIVSLTVAGAMTATMLAGCGGAASSAASSAQTAASTDSATSEAAPAEKHKIGVMFSSMGATQLQQKEYLENYIGPKYNVDFMFSEILKDNGAAITFIEQARAAGCEGLMNFYSDSIEQATATANEAGIYMINNNNYIPESTQDMAYNIGSMGTSVASTAEAYGELVKQELADGQPHNVVIVSGGNAQGNRQHRETTAAILQVLQDTYNLTYDKSIDDLSVSNVQTQVSTGTDMKIVIYPGYAGTDTYVTGFSSLLQSGEYDLVLSTYAVYPKLMQPISEVEEAFDMDVHLVSIAAIDDSATSAFAEGALNSALLEPGSMIVGAMFTVLYNAIEGNAAAIEKDGKPSQYTMLKWTCKNADEYSKLSSLNTSADTYAITTDDIDGLLVSKNADVNYDTVNGFFESLTAEGVLAKVGA